MAHKILDAVQETTTSTGIGALVLAGSAARMRSLSGAGTANGDTFYARIENTNGEYEQSVLCTYNAGSNSITRAFVPGVSSSSTGAIVSFSAGTKTVSCVDPAAPGLRPTRIVTSGTSTTMTAGDGEVIVNKTVSGAHAITLPPDPVAGQIAIVGDGKGDLDANAGITITVTPATGTINGESSFVIKTARASVLFRYNGTEWNAQPIGEPYYEAVRGEYGILDYTWPVGHAWRYGVLPDGVDHENNGRMGKFLRVCCLPGVTGFIPRGYYSFGFSTRAVMHKLRVVCDGAIFAGVFHGIGRASDFTQPTATVVMGSATVTVTIASPGVVSWTAHGLANGATVRFTTTGALPTGITAGTWYYVVNAATDTFQISATSGGAAINTSGSQSGTHTGYTGAISGNPTMTGAGSRYFAAAQGLVQGNLSGSYLSGTRIHSVMEASAVDTLVSGGGGHVVGNVIDFDDIQMTVDTVDAAGTILTWSITNRGSTTDPTTCTGAWGNQREQTDSDGPGTGARAIFDFRVKSWVTDAAGSGGPATANVLIRPAHLVEPSFEGTWKTVNRIGLQDTDDLYLQRGFMLQDTTLSIGGIGCPGGHWDGNNGLRVDYVYVQNTTQTSGQLYGWAGLSIDTSSPFASKRNVIGTIHIKQAAWHGFALNGDLKAQNILIEGAGVDSALVATQEFGPSGISTDAAMFLWYRGNLECDNLTIVVNQETIGAGFGFPLRCVSTGLPGQSGTSIAANVLSDSKNGLVETRNHRSFIGALTIKNICRKGVTFGDRDSSDNAHPANVRVGSLFASLSPSVAMTATYQMVHVESIGGGSLLKNVFDCDHAEFITHGINDRTDTLFADCFFADTSTIVRIGKAYFPLHGTGILAEIKGQADMLAIADMQSNLGLASGSTSPMFKLNGCSDSKIKIVANCNSANMQSQVCLVSGTTDCDVEVHSNRYRNKNIVEFSGTNTRLNFHDSVVTGLSGSEVGYYFGGTFADCSFVNNRATACDYGAKKNGSPTFTNCAGSGNRLYSNKTRNSDLDGFSILDLGRSMSLCPLQKASKTADYSVTAVADDGTEFNNTGAAGAVNLTLPAIDRPGRRYTATVLVAQSLQFTAQSGTTITVGASTSASGGNVASSTVNNQLTLEATSLTTWVATAECHGSGAWTVT